MAKKSNIQLVDRVKLKLAQLTISVIGSAEALRESANLPEKQKKAVEDMYAAYLYAFEQIQDVIFPVDCTQADVDIAMIRLGETIDNNEAAKKAVEKVKNEILAAAKA